MKTLGFRYIHMAYVLTVGVAGIRGTNIVTWETATAKNVLTRDLKKKLDNKEGNDE